MKGIQTEDMSWIRRKPSGTRLRRIRGQRRRTTCRPSSSRRGSRRPSPRTAACPTWRSSATAMREPRRPSRRRSSRLRKGRCRRSSIGSQAHPPAPSRPGGASRFGNTRSALTIFERAASKRPTTAWRSPCVTPSTSNRPIPSCRPTRCGATRRARPTRSCCGRPKRTTGGAASTSRRCCATRAASGSTTRGSRRTVPSAWTGSASRSPTSNRSARTSTTRPKWSGCTTPRSRSSSWSSSPTRPMRSSTTTTSSTWTTQATAPKTRTPRIRG